MNSKVTRIDDLACPRHTPAALGVMAAAGVSRSDHLAAGLGSRGCSEPFERVGDAPPGVGLGR